MGLGGRRSKFWQMCLFKIIGGISTLILSVKTPKTTHFLTSLSLCYLFADRVTVYSIKHFLVVLFTMQYLKMNKTLKKCDCRAGSHVWISRGKVETGNEWAVLVSSHTIAGSSREKRPLILAGSEQFLPIFRCFQLYIIKLMAQNKRMWVPCKPLYFCKR